ncbi:sodium-coupled neutral amino acid transporter 1-like [Acipenser oxyrinchus oxyrinchus]|uniref:Sodium-coupled neutral amino acid transporter 1-like n=1 Tax=Acipenser oxyrinchus oxyrinchus TaxID=40147 RepID=A0AAD8DFJ4_ACIOX|nr:sodium-coupled neutral amino acid transporter 1-like [Acipenser oxyrinchus oxyrinchus]
MNDEVGYSAELQSLDDEESNESSDPEDDEKNRVVFQQENAESRVSLTHEHLSKKKYQHPPSRTSFRMSVFNLSNAIMGSGILGLSYALANTGIILFVLILVSVTVLALYSIHLLLLCSKRTGCMVYEDLGYKAFGMSGKCAVFGSTFLQNIGAILSYMFIVKNELPLVLQFLTGFDTKDDSWYMNGDYLVILVTVVIILPLCLLKSLGYLGYTSGFSLACMVFFLIVIIYKKFDLPCPGLELNSTMQAAEMIPGNETGMCEPEYVEFNTKTIYALPTILFAYVCHPSILPIYSELKERSSKKMEHVSTVSFLSMFFMYILTAFFGYFTFYDKVNEDLLRTYDASHDVLILVVRLVVVTAVILTVPVLFFVVRKSVLELIEQKRFKWKFHICITLVLLAFSVVLVVFIPSIKDIFAVIGATSANMLMFILPSALYLKLETLTTKQKIKPVIFLAAGVLCTLVTVPLVIIDWVHTKQSNNTGH